MTARQPHTGERTAHNSNGHLAMMVVGGIIVVVGAILLAELVSLLPGGAFLPLPWVAVMVLVIGLSILPQGGGATTAGLLAIVLSAGYLMRYSGAFAELDFHRGWLILLILLGVLMFAGPRKEQR